MFTEICWGNLLSTGNLKFAFVYVPNLNTITIKIICLRGTIRTRVAEEMYYDLILTLAKQCTNNSRRINVLARQSYESEFMK